MISVWDYLMRRKALCLAAFLAALAGGILSYHAFQYVPAADHDPQYISIDTFGNTEDIEIPYTGGSVVPFFSVLQPSDLVTLPAPSSENDVAEPEPVLEDVSSLSTESPQETESSLNPAALEDVIADPAETAAPEEVAVLTDEDLNHLEPTELPSPAVMEILPASAQMSDEMLEYSVEALQEAITPDNVTESDSNQKNLPHILRLSTMSVIVLALGGYLTYWHFRR